MHEVLVNRLGGLSLPRKSVVRLTDRPDMTFDVYRGRKTTTQQYKQLIKCKFIKHHFRCLHFLALTTWRPRVCTSVMFPVRFCTAF